MRTGAAVKPIRPATATWSLLAVVVCSLFLPGQASVLGMPPPPQPSGRNRSPPVMPKPFSLDNKKKYSREMRQGKRVHDRRCSHAGWNFPARFRSAARLRPTAGARGRCW
jgi:hypothetical protein